MSGFNPYIDYQQNDGFGNHAADMLDRISPDNFIPQKTFESFAGKLLLLLVIVLMCIGVLAVYSSGAGWGTKKFADSEYFLWRQLFYTCMGIVVIFIVGGIDYKLIKSFSQIILIASIIMLGMLLVLKALGVIEGAARWLGYGKFKFQASDLAKYAMIIYLAKLLSEKQRVIKDLHKAYYPMVSVIIIIVALVALEPNFSTASILALIGFAMLFVGRVSLMHLFMTTLTIIPFAMIFAVAAPYRMSRLMTYLGQGNANESYQVTQALIGLGNGGLLGLGPGESKQRELFLPASYNDFIFAVIGEEYGFIGALVILMMFVGIVICGITIAHNALDDFGRFLAFGITTALGIYAFINAGVACHVLPTTGVSLPFISFGGSSALFNSLGVGILLSISREKKRIEKQYRNKNRERESFNDFEY